MESKKQLEAFYYEVEKRVSVLLNIADKLIDDGKGDEAYQTYKAAEHLGTHASAIQSLLKNY